VNHTTGFLGLWLRRLGLLLLPLGFWGVAGLIVLALYSSFNLLQLWRTSRHTLAMTLPFATITVIATALAAPHHILFALSYALLIISCGAVAHWLSRSYDRAILVAYYAVGSSVLALSVILDYSLRWHRIPSGLFLHNNLHNWTATLLVLAMPLALHYTTQRKTWEIGLTMLTLLMAATVLALSWVGLLGVSAVLLTYALCRHPGLGLIALLGTAATLTAAGVALSQGVQLHPNATLQMLGQIVHERMTIFSEGITLAAQRPWLGWGFGPDSIRVAYQQVAIGTYTTNDMTLSHFHNLFVQTLLHSGVLGLTALGLLLYQLWRYQCGRWRHVSRAALVGFIVAQFFDYAMLQGTIVASFFWVTALGLKPDMTEST
jgi:O-antigen ligase